MAETPNIEVDSRFAVEDPDTIAHLLRRMVEQRSMLEAGLPGTGPGMLSAVLDVDERRRQMVLDATPHASVERVALAQPQLSFSARVDRVDVSFTTGPLQKISFEGMPAYRAPFPETMRYLQRREFFRIEVPSAHPAYCQLLVPADEDHPPRDLRTRIFDISAGGLSVFVPIGEEKALASGARFTSSKLMLPESSPIPLGLRVKRVFRINRRGVMSQTCAGCEYINLSAVAQSTIQRYLMRLDRERILREKGR